MINTKELDKLEKYLEENNYNYERLKVFSGEQIKVFDAKNTVSWDVVIHEYSWGHKDGLLEIMSGDNHMVDHNSHEDGVEGFLDADTIINRLESIGQNLTYEDIGVDIKTTNPNGIIVWLGNGDKIIYYPNFKEEEVYEYKSLDRNN